MKMDLFNSCYNIATLATCVLDIDEENMDWIFSKEKQIVLTDNLSLLVRYTYISSDYMSLYDYEDHRFTIRFFRDNELIDGFAFNAKLPKIRFGSIANPELSTEVKMQAINAIKPKLVSRISGLKTKTNLNSEEINVIVNKSRELVESALALLPAKTKTK